MITLVCAFMLAMLFWATPGGAGKQYAYHLSPTAMRIGEVNEYCRRMNSYAAHISTDFKTVLSILLSSDDTEFFVRQLEADGKTYLKKLVFNESKTQYEIVWATTHEERRVLCQKLLS